MKQQTKLHNLFSISRYKQNTTKMSIHATSISVKVRMHSPVLDNTRYLGIEPVP